jgi:hypothetical protein
VLKLNGSYREKRILEFSARKQVYFTFFLEKKGGPVVRLEFDNESYTLQARDGYITSLSVGREEGTEIPYEFKAPETLLLGNRRKYISMGSNTQITLRKKFDLLSDRWEIKTNDNLFGEIASHGLMSFSLSPNSLKVVENDHPQWKFICGLCWYTMYLDALSND